ncbi:MAG TPA: midcut-by-XrtH protein [Candidatus Margulisiibacteriota bacterium]|nr:midcut-by-XrtH protein [Candidatus Margulisiibacteriota bacterium]
MKVRGSLYFGTFGTTLLTPFAASAATVTTVPVGPAAPALGTTMLVLLAVALTVGAVCVLRRKAARVASTLALVAAVIGLAGLAYAGFATVTVSGGQCTMRTTQIWNALNPTLLENQCGNELLIEAIDLTSCTDDLGTAAPDLFPFCVVGQTLAAGASCELPQCA